MNGIYSKTNDKRIMQLFFEEYHNAIKESNVMASFTFDSGSIKSIQNNFSKQYNLP